MNAPQNMDARTAGVLAATAGAASLAALAFGSFAPPAALASGLAAALAALGAAWLTLRVRPASASPAAQAPSGRMTAAALEPLAPLLEALPDPALLIDPEGRVVGSNAAARGQLQFEASGLRFSSILRNPELNDAVQAAAHDGVSRTVEYATLSPVEAHFKAYVAPVSFQGESAALMVFHDQTTLIATERMRADFLANASHELRTPLASLLLLIETLGGHAKDDAEAQARFLAMMQVQADRMSRLVQDLLSLSKIELNEHVPPTDSADLAAIAREAADAMAPLARERDVRVEIRVAAEPAMVVGDRFQLAQVAHNLIDNAVKYSRPQSVVRVEIGLADTREDAAERAGRQWPDSARIALLTPAPRTTRGYAYLRVADEGPGIARRHLPRLAERFYRVERDETRERTGTGLGLAIVKHILSRHRGGLVVESVVERGAAFAVFVERAPS